MENFAAHVKLMHTDGDYRFNQEFEVKLIIFILSVFSICLSLLILLSMIQQVKKTHGQKVAKLGMQFFILKKVLVSVQKDFNWKVKGNNV